EKYVTDGWTTVVTGNCGGSEADLGAWFRALEKTGIGLNLASLIGHNTVRREVMGTANRPATGEEIARMQATVDKNMRDGAVGFSTGLIYIPGTYSNADEVVALAKAASRYDGGYASHRRAEGPRGPRRPGESRQDREGDGSQSLQATPRRLLVRRSGILLVRSCRGRKEHQRDQSAAPPQEEGQRRNSDHPRYREQRRRP